MGSCGKYLDNNNDIHFIIVDAIEDQKDCIRLFRLHKVSYKETKLCISKSFYSFDYICGNVFVFYGFTRDIPIDETNKCNQNVCM